MANIDDAFTINKLSLDDNLLIVSGTVDPTIDSGYEAPVGSLYVRTTGETYQKNNINDVDWVKLSTNLDVILNNTFEPTGFTNRIDSNISFDDGTRTFTISPVVTDYTYFIKGVQYTITTPKSLVLPDVSGLSYIYLDENESLNISNTFTYDIISIYAFVCVIYWNAETSTAIYFGEERHGITMDSQTHIHLHMSLGTQHLTGLKLGNMITTGNGSLDSHNFIDVSNGTIRDEDIQLDIIDGNPQQLTSNAQLPVFYKFGINGYWRKKNADSFPFIQSGVAGYTGASALPAFNELVGNDWQLNEITNNNFFFVHIIATNNITEPVVAILGINQYQNKPQGQAEARSEINSLTGLPFQEFTPLATVIYEARTAFTNTVNSRLVRTSDGGDYIDWTSEIDTFDVGYIEKDELVKVSSNDSTAAYLSDKLVSGASLIITENNDGLNETLTLDTTIPISSIQQEIDNIESASGGIFSDDGTYDGTTVDLALSNVTGSTSLLNTLTQLDTAISLGGGGGGGGATQLNHLNDVTVVTPNDGQSLIYNTTTSQWENITTTVIGAGIGRLIQLKFNVIPALAGTVLIPYTNPLVTDGVELWSDTLTLALPTSSIVRIAMTATVSGSTNSTEMLFAFFRDSVCIGTGLVSMSARTAGHPFAITLFDNPGVNTPITYSCRVGKTIGNTWYVNRLSDDSLLINGQLEKQTYSIEEIGVG